MKRINKINAAKAVSDQTAGEWAYGAGFEITGEIGIIGIHTDKRGRAWTHGAIPVEIDAFDAWCFDKRIVAMVADLELRVRNGEIQYPDKGDEIHLPTDEEAAAIFRKYGIPQDEDGAENLYAECEPIDENGNPVED